MATAHHFSALKEKPRPAWHLVGVEKAHANIFVKEFVDKTVLIILAMYLWLKPFCVVIRSRCFAVILLMMCSALPHVEQNYHVVISVLAYAAIANKVVHTNCANVHVVDHLFVRTVVKQRVVSLARPVTENVTDLALMENAKNVVPSCVTHAQNHAHGTVLITSAIIFVERNATALVVMHPVPRSSLAVTHVLACAGKIAPLCAPFVILRSFLQC